MASAEDGSTSAQAEAGVASPAGPLAPDVGGPRPHRQVWAIALSAGLAAGLVAWLGGELAHNAFRPQLFKYDVLGSTGLQPSEGLTDRRRYQERDAHLRHPRRRDGPDDGPRGRPGGPICEACCAGRSGRARGRGDRRRPD